MFPASPVAIPALRSVRSIATSLVEAAASRIESSDVPDIGSRAARTTLARDASRLARADAPMARESSTTIPYGRVQDEFTLLPEPLTTRPTRTVKKECTPEQLGLIRDGDKAIKICKELLYYGAGNTNYDVSRSGGRSKETMIWARACYDARKSWGETSRELIGSQAATAVAARGGNCGEHSLVVAALLDAILKPGTIINRCHFPGLDHAFVVIGDLSGDKSKLVVVDAWPPAGQACVATDFKFGDSKDLEAMETFEAKGGGLVKATLPMVVDIDVMTHIKAKAKEEVRAESGILGSLSSAAINAKVNQIVNSMKKDGIYFNQKGVAMRDMEYLISPLIKDNLNDIESYSSGEKTLVTPAPFRSKDQIGSTDHQWSDEYTTEWTSEDKPADRRSGCAKWIEYYADGVDESSVDSAASAGGGDGTSGEAPASRTRIWMP